LAVYTEVTRPELFCDRHLVGLLNVELTLWLSRRRSLQGCMTVKLSGSEYVINGSDQAVVVDGSRGSASLLRVS
jgi:hypothetical protein